MSARHTPGPWRVVEQAIDEGGEPAFISICAGRLEVANTCSGDFASRVERANANLIATAPDMRLLLLSADSFMLAAVDGRPIDSDAARIWRATLNALMVRWAGAHEVQPAAKVTS